MHEAHAEIERAGAAASEALQQQFSLSKEQAEGVLNMSLRRLTSLEANRLQEESQQLHARFAAHLMHLMPSHLHGSGLHLCFVLIFR